MTARVGGRPRRLAAKERRRSGNSDGGSVFRYVPDPSPGTRETPAMGRKRGAMPRHDLASLRPAGSVLSAGPAFCPLIRCRHRTPGDTESGPAIRDLNRRTGFARLVLAGRLPALAGPATMKTETASRRRNQVTAWHRRVITPRTLTSRPRTQPDPPYGYRAKDVRGRQHEPRAGGRAAQDGVPHACGPADPRT